MLNVMVAGLLCISMFPVASSCNLSAHIINFYANIKKILSFLKRYLYEESSPLWVYMGSKN